MRVRSNNKRKTIFFPFFVCILLNCYGHYYVCVLTSLTSQTKTIERERERMWRRHRSQHPNIALECSAFCCIYAPVIGKNATSSLACHIFSLSLSLSPRLFLFCFVFHWNLNPTSCLLKRPCISAQLSLARALSRINPAPSTGKRIIVLTFALPVLLSRNVLCVPNDVRKVEGLKQKNNGLCTTATRTSCPLSFPRNCFESQIKY